jgi:hypothetical protein
MSTLNMGGVMYMLEFAVFVWNTRFFLIGHAGAYEGVQKHCIRKKADTSGLQAKQYKPMRRRS